MARILFPIADTTHDLECLYPYYRLQEEGHDVVLAGPKKITYTAKYGYPLETQITLEEAANEQFDAIVIPGGFAPDKLRANTHLLEMVKKADNDKKPIAAICHAGWVLVSAGILKGKKATAVSLIKDDISNAGAEFVDEEVVVDGNLITSRTPKDLIPFTKAILESLK